MKSNYDTDFHAWTQEQAQRLKDGDWQNIDVLNLVEEIQSLGKQQRQELRNRLAILIGHLLKWQFQSDRHSRSWLATIRVQRRDLDRLIEDSPSLKAYFNDAIAHAYENARDLAIAETDLPETTFPETCPYTIDQIRDRDFYPGPTELTQP
ncbi:MAG: DUF29 domain-containing protein [Cyanophyceae cyanobacterium]